MQTNDTRSNTIKLKTLGGVAGTMLSGLAKTSGHIVGSIQKAGTIFTGGLCLHVLMAMGVLCLFASPRASLMAQSGPGEGGAYLQGTQLKSDC